MAWKRVLRFRDVLFTESVGIATPCLPRFSAASKETEPSDFSVCTTWGMHQKQRYLLDVFHAKLDFPEIRRAVIEQAARQKPAVILIEDKTSGIALIQSLRQEGLSTVKAFKPEGDKFMRMHAQTAQIEGGFVLLPQRAPWLPIYVAELTTFPKGKHDDQVDSTSQALRWMQVEGEVPGLLQFYRELRQKGAA